MSRLDWLKGMTTGQTARDKARATLNKEDPRLSAMEKLKQDELNRLTEQQVKQPKVPVAKKNAWSEYMSADERTIYGDPTEVPKEVAIAAGRRDNSQRLVPKSDKEQDRWATRAPLIKHLQPRKNAVNDAAADEASTTSLDPS